MKHKKGKIFQALNFALPLLLGAALVGAVFIFLGPRLLPFIAGFFSVSVPEPSAVSREDSRSFASTLAQGSFTELFSGAGWMNNEKTNVYQDDKLSSISFPPDYEWEEVPALSNSIKNETIIAANGNGKEVVLIADDGKIFAFGTSNSPFFKGSTPEGGGIFPIEQIGQVGTMLKGALLDYDDAKQTWVVAAATADGVIMGPIGKIGLISPIKMSLINPIDLACANGECLLLANQSIYSFSEANPSLRAVSILSLRGASAASNEAISNNQPFSLSLGKAGDVLLVGAVEKIDGIYNGSIFKYSSNLLSSLPADLSAESLLKVEALAKAGGSFQSLMINDQSLFSSAYPGTIRFGYDKENSEILALYAAYIGQAYKFSVDSRSDSRFFASTTDDYSRFFPQRVMDGNNTPKIFKYGNAWWLSSEVNKPVVSGVEPSSPKFVRIEGGAGIDFADILIRGKKLVASGAEPAFELLPGFDPRESASINNTNPRLSASTLYALAAGQDGAKIYRFIDKGYKKDKKLVWESLRLNRFDNEIVSGRFYKIHGSTSFDTAQDKSLTIKGGESSVIASGAKQSQDNISVNPLLSESNPRQSASILYYLSNDGGKNWQEAKLNEKIDFQTKGNDFRFKVEINPDADVSQTPRESASTAKTIRVNPPLNFTTPWLNLVSVEYYSTPNP